MLPTKSRTFPSFLRFTQNSAQDLSALWAVACPPTQCLLSHLVLGFHLMRFQKCGLASPEFSATTASDACVTVLASSSWWHSGVLRSSVKFLRPNTSSAS